MSEDNEKKIQELKSKIISYKDFPKKGILFWDIFSALSSGPTCKLLQSLLVDSLQSKFAGVEALVALEARGFLFAYSLAAELGLSCIPVRKKGKLPGEIVSYSYSLEYGTDILEIQKDSIKPGLKCVLIDDLLATGGTLEAAAHLLKNCGADVRGALVVMELVSLEGRKKISDIPLHSLIQYD